FYEQGRSPRTPDFSNERGYGIRAVSLKVRKGTKEILRRLWNPSPWLTLSYGVTDQLDSAPSDLRYSRSTVLGAVRGRTEQVKRHVGLGPDHPGVVPRRNREDIAGLEDLLGAVSHQQPRSPGEDEADVLHFAQARSGFGPYVLGPTPPRFIGCSAEEHSTHSN